MSNIDVETMVRVRLSNTICWSRKSGVHWIKHSDIEESGQCRCSFCGLVLPKEEVDNAIKEK